MSKLENKHIILGVTGSISAFKSVSLASKLTQEGAAVDVIATQNALKFVGTASFEGITHRKCFTDTFEDCDDLQASHVTLGTHADLVLIAPCSANMIGKMAHGIADDKLSTTMLAVHCPIILAPAMNCFMYQSPAVQENIAILKRRGVDVLDPDSGALACGYAGKGRMPEPEVLLELILQKIAIPRSLANFRVLVTAGATREPIDAVRYISNPSTGKMGFACARAALMAGAQTTVIACPNALSPVLGARQIDVVTAADMAEAVLREAPAHDIVIMAAAVSDFTPKYPVAHKIHKESANLSLELSRTSDILAALGETRRPGQFLCGFCMESDDLLARAAQKLTAKNLDMIVANSISPSQSAFASDTNAVSILTPNFTKTVERAAKIDIAIAIIEEISQLYNITQG